VTRKDALRDRANRYAHGQTLADPGFCWEEGYRAALKDVRKALKQGPYSLKRFLYPIR
jgi:hypothetical protein